MNVIYVISLIATVYLISTPATLWILKDINTPLKGCLGSLLFLIMPFVLAGMLIRYLWDLFRLLFNVNK